MNYDLIEARLVAKITALWAAYRAADGSRTEPDTERLWALVRVCKLAKRNPNAHFAERDRLELLGYVHPDDLVIELPQRCWLVA